jgi:hypothetical protein
MAHPLFASVKRGVEAFDVAPVKHGSMTQRGLSVVVG